MELIMSKSIAERVVITVDGLSGSGKTTLAKMLAAKLRFAHLNSGLLYRGLAWMALQEGIPATDEREIVGLLSRHEMILQKTEEGASALFIDGAEKTREVQEPRISELTSQLSLHREVRSALLPLQREAFAGSGIIAEGRDMGTVVFPEAPIKFFIEVPEEVRIQRRVSQLYGQEASQILSKATSQAEVLRKNIEIEIRARDKRDMTRLESPAIAASDAIIVDNSAQTLTLVLESMYSAVLQRGLIKH